MIFIILVILLIGERMKTHFRTATCGELNKENVGKTVTLAGWVKRIRIHGNIMFIDLGDRYGITQIVVEKTKETEKLTKESVIQVTGEVRKRPEANPKLKTGDIEVEVKDLKILSLAEKIPIDLSEETTTNEEMRLKYRYLDLRRKTIQEKLVLRHKIMTRVRNFFDKNNFVEIETPILTKSTPEGARDYLVPSRLHPGKFYALPQSPQQFKQLLMIAGFDRYFQIARCFRDEDLRADRQPEFDQIDLEMSFISQEDIMNLIENLMKQIFEEIGEKLKLPFKRMTYYDALNRFGSDKPDLRFKPELISANSAFKNSSFNIFRELSENGTIKALLLKHCATFSKSNIKRLEEIAKEESKGMSYLKYSENITGSLAKFKEELKPFLDGIGFEKGDLLIFIADKKWKIACESLGKVRVEARNMILNNQELFEKYNNKLWKDGFEFLWVTDFPLFSWSEEENRFVSEHHPFTAPREDFKDKLDEYKDKLDKVISQSYDLVLNGEELGSGSIRIHEPELQKKIFSILGLTQEDIKVKFGHLVNAFKYGAPPHGGIALGLDRLVSIMAKTDNIRDVIAFPKNSLAVSPMDDCPSEVSKKQLDELHIEIKKE